MWGVGGGGNYCEIGIAWVYQIVHPFSRTLQYVIKSSFHRDKHSRIRQKTISEKIWTNVYLKERLKNASVKMLSNRYFQWRNAYCGSCSFGMLNSLVPKKTFSLNFLFWFFFFFFFSLCFDVGRHVQMILIIVNVVMNAFNQHHGSYHTCAFVFGMWP